MASFYDSWRLLKTLAWSGRLAVHYLFTFLDDCGGWVGDRVAVGGGMHSLS